MRHRKIISHVSAVLIAASLSSQAFAFNELFLGRGPLAHLTRTLDDRARRIHQSARHRRGWPNAYVEQSGN